MKNLQKTVLLAAFATLGFVACQPDEEPAPADARDPFVASWTCAETSSQIGNVSPYTVHINKSTTNSTQVLIENFYNVGFGIKAIGDVTGSAIVLNQQVFNGTNQLHGSGSKTGANTINLTYYMDDGTSVDTCVATYSRQ